ncbi:uncharacterized protein MELLADRAFT_75154 [Melampsora larici-populina 98AG31]|uniref:Uncharacterized protein n=1 Tax=Melampsora larici-populina (strain 98AG31 / pathotype 3-4-7) TaxID=747676 RepID=F4RSL9_MELLP|nr:uncharacterized protein MELLADRAFT_75154 [Melampsora larici-populina 98AG31]EGG04668.1 hypothetical protein MELLADRAFT_75154 [Melampsora larici-populina 98AG31]
MAKSHKKEATRFSVPTNTLVPPDPSSKQFPDLTFKITITKARTMVNQKLFQVPSPADGRIDTMSHVIRTRSYQAMMAQGTPQSPLFNRGSSLRLSPNNSPVNGRLIGLSTTSMINFVNNASAGPTNSQSSLVLSLNPHINPLIFSTLGSSSKSFSGSPSTICTSLPTGALSSRNSPNKRPAPIPELSDDDDKELPVDAFDDPRITISAEAGDEDGPDEFVGQWRTRCRRGEPPYETP